MATTAEMEAKRKKYTNYAMWAVGIGALALAGPIIFMALKGLVALIAFGLVGVTALTLAPVIAMKLANWKIQSIKAEAAANPIETLQNMRLEKAEQLGRGWDALKQIKTSVRNFQDKVDSFKEKFGQEDRQTIKFAEQLNTMRQVESQTQNRMERAAEALNLFDKEIERAGMIWEVALAGQKATNAAKMNSEDIYEKIKADTAIDSVSSSLNSVFAELETNMNEESTQLALGEGAVRERQEVKLVSRVTTTRD